MDTNRRGLISFIGGLFCGVSGASALKAGDRLIEEQPLKLEGLAGRTEPSPASAPSSIQKAIAIEPGKAYVIETDDFLTVALAHHIKSEFEALTGAKCVLLHGGMKIARPSPPVININAMDAASFKSYLRQNSDAVAEAVTDAVYKGCDLTALHQV